MALNPPRSKVATAMVPARYATAVFTGSPANNNAFSGIRAEEKIVK